MPQEGQYSLNHYAALDFAPAFWQLDRRERGQRLKQFFSGLGEAADSFHIYQSYPLETNTEFLVWTASQVSDTQLPKKFFGGWAEAAKPLKPYLIHRHTLWGFTRPSQYSKAKSSQEIDPFSPKRSTYLVMYPFTKTADWYLLSQEDRQEMMNSHIRVGKGFREITQLLLYSFGLQDQEFIVVYETEDLQMFSKLVYDLRNTKARVYTKDDTPLHAGIYRTVEEALAHFG